jgi:hypothetical protein
MGGCWLGWRGVDASVLMEPWFEMLAPLLGVLVGPGLRPFFDCSLDEAFRFSVGSRGVGPGAGMRV